MGIDRFHYCPTAPPGISMWILQSYPSQPNPKSCLSLKAYCRFSLYHEDTIHRTNEAEISLSLSLSVIPIFNPSPNAISMCLLPDPGLKSFQYFLITIKSVLWALQGFDTPTAQVSSFVTLSRTFFHNTPLSPSNIPHYVLPSGLPHMFLSLRNTSIWRWILRSIAIPRRGLQPRIL